MIRRFYADNFRCLVNFELELAEENIFLGANGTGKTSVLNVLRKIQDLVVRGSKVDEVFPGRDLSLGQRGNEQRFELEVQVDGHAYRYVLTLEHDRERGRVRIKKETLEHDGNPLFAFNMGDAQLYHDDYSEGPKYPFDWTQSGISVLNERHDNQKLTRFKKEVANCIIVRPCPPLFEPETRKEEEFLTPSMRNFAGWYDHASHENMGAITTLFAQLGEVLPGFDSISLTKTGENARTLKATFHNLSNKPIRYEFDQLSDGQRALIALYGLIFLSEDRRVSLFIDEPDNYLSLTEIQPWPAAAVERCGESLEQIVIVSHHPIVIDYMAGAKGRWFSRQDNGPVRVSHEPKRAVDGLSLSETVSRGWDEWA